jgi:hypothetical protein
MDAVEAYDAYQGTVQELSALIYDGPTSKNSDRLRQLNDEAIERLVAAERKTALCLERPLKPTGPTPRSLQGNARNPFLVRLGSPRAHDASHQRVVLLSAGEERRRRP